MTTETTVETQAVVVAQPIDLVSAALVECQGKLKSASMDATNPFFKSRYATLGAVIEASREALYGAGLAIQQTPSICADIVSVHTVIRHKSGQFLDGGSMALAIGENERNSDAQLAGSILTYLKRYAWASVLGIYADEDDDGNSAPQRPPGAIPRRQTTISPHQTNQNAHQSHLSVPVTTSGPVPQPMPTEKHRLKALNNLQAAPGQQNVPMMEGFLRLKGWIGMGQSVMDWPLEHVPATAEAMSKLSEDVIKFEIDQRQPQNHP